VPSHMIALVARIRAYLAATKPPPAGEVKPVEWRYLYYGKGNWKHVYNADAAAALYAESAALPKRKQHVIEPLYTRPDASPPMPGRTREQIIADMSVEAALSAASAVRSEPVGVIAGMGLTLLSEGYSATVWPVGTNDITDDATTHALYTSPVQTRENGIREAAACVLDFCKIYEEQPQGDTNKATARALRLASADILELLSQPEPKGDKA
jgi:hypothetical protein